jgi:ATP-binding cassette subfamily B protein
MPKKENRFKIKDALLFIWQYLKKYHWYLLILLVALLVIALADVFTPYLLGKIVDSFLSRTLILGLSLQTIIFIWIIVTLTKIFSGRVKSRVTVRLETATEKDLVMDLTAKIFSVPVKYHYNRKPGEILKKIDRAINAISSVIESMVYAFLGNLTSMIMALLVILGIKWQISLLNFIILVLFFLISIKFRLKPILRLRKKINTLYDKIFGNIGDFIANIFTVKIYTSEKRELARLGNDYNRILSLVDNQMKYWTQVNVTQAILTNGGIITTIIMGSYYMINGQITVGQFTTLVAFIPLIYQPIWWMADQYRALKRMAVDIYGAQQILNLKAEPVFSPEQVDLKITGEVEFNKVSFKYPERGQGILNEVSFKINQGQTLAIFGETGSGKTTIYNLLLRLYDNDSGQILFNGHDARTISREAIRSQIAVVPQDPSLFNESILYNIQYGNPQATKDEVIAAAKIANAHNFISKLPKGYDSKVGERGVKLSGGQVQRIAIARAAIRNPKILILDEATTSLDQKTKFEVLDALQNLIKGRTTIIITHDFSAITQSADQIIVLDQGKIVQHGKHHQLVSQSGLYRDLWQTQQKHLKS